MTDVSAESMRTPRRTRTSGDLHLVSAYGPSAGSARVRLHDWAEHLGLPHSSHGYRGSSSNSLRDIVGSPVGTVRAEVSTRRLPAMIAGETVVLSRAATPFSRGEVEESLFRRAGRGVYDVDDAIMLPEAGFRDRLFPKAGVFARATVAADTVIAGNDYLAERAADYADDVRVIPSCVEPANYTPLERPRTDRSPRLVWIGSPSTERYLSSIAPAVVAACRRAETRLIVISAGSAPIDGLAPEVVERIPWSASSFATSLALGDVGIMPLADTEWERGKCAYKLLQYGASGLPVVATPVGANIPVIAAMGAPGPRTVDEWSDALQHALTCSPEERFAAGRKAHGVVVDRYSFAANDKAWRRAVGLLS